MSSYRHKSSAPKKLDIPTAAVSIDTVARLPDVIQYHVRVGFICSRENKHAAVNDSLLGIGLLQSDYFAINNSKLTPKTTIPSFVRQYIKQYMGVAQLVRRKGRNRSQLIEKLTIKTELRTATDEYIIALSHIVVNDSNDQFIKYAVVRNFDPQSGKFITLQDQFSKNYKEMLIEEIIVRLAEKEDLERDDMVRLQAEGYFTGIAPYPANNLTLTDDLTVLIYSPSKISQKEVRTAISNRHSL